MTTASRLWAASAVLFLVPLILIIVGRPLDARLGLSGRYYATQDWQGDAVLRIDHGNIHRRAQASRPD